MYQSKTVIHFAFVAIFAALLSAPVHATGPVRGDSIYLFNANGAGLVPGFWVLAENDGGTVDPSGNQLLPLTSFTAQAFNDGALLPNPNNPLVGDVNGDGVSDLATYGRNLNDHTIVLGRNSDNVMGTGNLNKLSYGQTGWPVNWSPRFDTAVTATLLGDVNGDGKDDALFVRPSATNPGILEWSAHHSDAQGLEGNAPVVTNGFFRPHSLGGQKLVGDFNGDGADDIAAQDPGTAFIVGSDSTPGVGLNNGGDRFWGAVGFAANPITTLVGDINGDGLDDIVEVDDRGGIGNWGWVAGLTGPSATPAGIGIGTGGISWAFPFNLHPNSTSATPLLADMDNDGRDDLVIYEEYMDVGGTGTIWGRVLVSLTDDGAGGLFTNGFDYGAGFYDYEAIFGVDASGMIPVVGNVHVVPTDNADFAGEGVVGGKSFLNWQRGFGTLDGTAAHGEGDANGDGNVAGIDRELWESQFGGSSTALAAAGVVPEPGSMLLLGMGGILLLGGRRKAA